MKEGKIMITRTKAIELLMADNQSITDLVSKKEAIFDEYGNYNYPLDAKAKVPNIATGYIFVDPISVS